jgi:peptide/nickel transport system permease protein
VAKYLVRRIVYSLLVTFGVLVFVFFMLQIVGDPVKLMLPSDVPEKTYLEMREALGFNDPLPERFAREVGGWIHGDFGDSLWQQQPALPLALQRIPRTLFLTLVTLSFAVPIALLLGAYSAIRPNSFIDRVLTGVSLAGISVADFWLGLMLMLVFAVKLEWVPTSGFAGYTHLQYVILPALALAFRPIGRIAQVGRSALVEEMEKPYILTARSKGLTEGQVVRRHALRNALIPTLTVVGDETATFLNGAVVIETIFAWPGIGQLFIQAIIRRDLPLVSACVFVVALMTITLNLIVDLTYAGIDSRARVAK